MSESEEIEKYIEDSVVSVYGSMLAEVARSIHNSCGWNGVPESRDKVLYEVLRRSIGAGILYGQSK